MQKRVCNIKHHKQNACRYGKRKDERTQKSDMHMNTLSAGSETTNMQKQNWSEVSVFMLFTCFNVAEGVVDLNRVLCSSGLCCSNHYLMCVLVNFLFVFWAITHNTCVSSELTRENTVFLLKTQTLSVLLIFSTKTNLFMAEWQLLHPQRGFYFNMPHDSNKARDTEHYGTTWLQAGPLVVLSWWLRTVNCENKQDTCRDINRKLFSWSKNVRSFVPATFDPFCMRNYSWQESSDLLWHWMSSSTPWDYK